ncbi:MAG: PAS domain S-box protein [Cyanobacteriota bacterium]|nr:PAS domain S-box protein [Cyanobacteriota bacterium]
MDNSLPLQFALDDLECFFTRSPHLLAITGEDGYFKRVNAAFSTLLGCSEEQLRPLPFLESVHPEERELSQKEIARLSDRSATIEFRCRFRTGDGRWKWLEWKISFLREVTDGSALFYCTARNLTEQYTIGQTAQEQEHRFRAIFHQSLQFLWLLTPEGTLLEANETALIFRGVSEESVVGRVFWETPWWPSGDRVCQQLQDAIATSIRATSVRETPTPQEIDILDANDAAATIEFSLKPLYDEAGEVKLLVAQGCNVTQRKVTDLALRRLNLELEARVNQRTAEIQRYAEAVENMQDGFYLWQLENPDDTRSFRLHLANPAAETLSTVPNEEVLGKTMLEAFPRMFETDLPETYRQVMLCDRKRSLDVDYRLPSGENRTFTVRIFPLADRCLGVLFNDVTDKRRVQKQLKEQRGQLKILFEKAGIGIARLDIQGNWIQANDRLCEILGYPRQELLQTDFQSITHADDAAVDAQYYEALLCGELETVSMDKRYIRQNGEAVWCSVTASMVRDDRQQPLYFIAFIDDITERKTAALKLQRKKNELTQINSILARTMNQLEQRNQELDRFAYVASHDLKAPLRAIANLSTWIEEDIGNDLPEENREQLDLLQGRVHRMERLIDGLLAYSRAGRSAQTVEEVDLNELLKEEIDLLAPMADLSIDIAPDLPIFSTNRVPLARVFSNLIGNAIKHHDRPNGRIEIRCKPRSNSFYEFTVADDGPGIDEAYHSKIFEIFQVLESRDTLESTGIGLAIVKKIVEAEGGEISVYSQLGRGSTFRFTWPMQAQL